MTGVGKMVDWLRRPVRRLAALVRSGWPRRGLIAEACFNLLVVEAKLKLVPLKRQGLREIRQATDPLPAGSPRIGDEAERKLAIQIGWAVARSAHYLPAPARCLAQALAARAMLHRRGIGSIMRIGVAHTDGASFEAHAWLEAAGIEVTGYPVPPQLREIGCLFSERSR